MKCRDAVHALLEASPPWSPELRLHLEGCARCRSLAALHVSASGLGAPALPALPAIAREGVLGEVRRRRVRRRTFAVAAASLGVAGLAWMILSSSSPPPELSEDRVEVVDTGQPPRPEGSLTREAAVEDAAQGEEGPAERDALAALVVEVRGYSRRDVVGQDDVYRRFGALASWVRPPDSRALEATPFRTALMPLVYLESNP
ncbi:hypothetical protein LZ198_31220 [Myxococcus sp. K15C18031901]|uniref:hypothetical protein n=1 Tax=Myxococcus dinghuensis TaxID=2906761 RepID=UPI0020A80AE9|nr:hypothetical protein [Myxococcus dinghuensis]MCP3103363.1 hypothetical protein [Myxococcus dinghuensis]